MSLPPVPSLRRALDEYPTVVERQGSGRLPALDRWYREELPGRIAGRTPGFVTHEELVRLTEWKMARGVWRARNLVLVRGNDPESVSETSRAALSTIPHPTAPVSALSRLRGIGPATASAVAAAAAPDVYPFFDELVAGALFGSRKVAWTLGFYARYADALRARARELGSEWTPALLERAIWSHLGGKAGAG